MSSLPLNPQNATKVLNAMPLPELLRTITSFVSLLKPVLVIALLVLVLLVLLVGGGIAIVVVTVKQGRALKTQIDEMKDHVTRNDLQALQRDTMSSVRSAIMESSHEVGKQLTAQANATTALISTLQTMHMQNARPLQEKTDHSELGEHMKALAKHSIDLTLTEQKRQRQQEEQERQRQQEQERRTRLRDWKPLTLADQLRHRSATQGAPVMPPFNTDLALGRLH